MGIRVDTLKNLITNNSWVLVALGIILLYAVFIIIDSFGADGFRIFQPIVYSNIFINSVVWGLLAIGILMLMVSGEFDLSVGSTLAVGGFSYILGLDLGWGYPLSILFALGVTALLGAINGAIVVRTGNPSFIITLGTLYVYRGISFEISGRFFEGRQATYQPEAGVIPEPSVWDRIFANPLVAKPAEGEYPAVIQWFLEFLSGLNTSIIWFIALVFILVLVLTRTKFGNWLYATGGNNNAARSVGVPTKWVKFSMFVFVAMMAGLAGIINSTNIIPFADAPDQLSLTIEKLRGNLWELYAVAACVIGGAKLAGGFGTVVGAALGVVLLRLLQQGLSLSGQIIPALGDVAVFGMAFGLILILMATISQFIGRVSK